MTIWFPYTHSVVPNYKIKTTFLDNLVSDGVITTISFLKHLLWLLQQVFFFCLHLRKIIVPTRIRTWRNPLIRSQMPYPLGHGVTHRILFYLYLVSLVTYQLYSLKKKEMIYALFAWQLSILHTRKLNITKKQWQFLRALAPK